jgi:putative membrane protein
MKFRSVIAMMLLAGCASAPTGGKLTDPQIAMVMRVLNLGEVRESEIARDKTASAAVREFAQMMINDHEAQSNKAEAELARVDINSEDTTVSRQLDATSGAATDRLRGLSGEAFDRAYMDREVEAHQSALNLIDTQLVPNARKKQVKEQLTALRKLVDAHLTRARQIRLNLEKRP